MHIVNIMNNKIIKLIIYYQNNNMSIINIMMTIEPI